MMTKFILKTLGFTFVILMVFIWVCSQANGYTDPYYIRFTTPKQSSLILGTSRAAQGLQPEVFNLLLNEKIFNYAFTIGHSPFGETYLKSIKKKLDTQSKDGLFVIAVDPWSVSSLTKIPYKERNLALGNTPFVNQNPNIFYILNNWNEKYYQIIRHKKSKMFLHTDGWLEVSVNLNSKNAERTEKYYRKKMLPQARLSENRLNYLKETISFLKKHGEVYLVRLPIHPKIMQMENELMPEFRTDILEAINLSDGYLDLTEKNGDFLYIDGNHLYKTSGKKVSEIVANWILKKRSFPKDN